MKKALLGILLSALCFSAVAQHRVTPETRITVHSYSDVKINDNGEVSLCLRPAYSARRSGVYCGLNDTDKTDRSTPIHAVKRQGYVLSAVDINGGDTGYVVTLFWEPVVPTKPKK